jgi:hypothetical protein
VLIGLIMVAIFGLNLDDTLSKASRRRSPTSRRVTRRAETADAVKPARAEEGRSSGPPRRRVALFAAGSGCSSSDRPATSGVATKAADAGALAAADEWRNGLSVWPSDAACDRRAGAGAGGTRLRAAAAWRANDGDLLHALRPPPGGRCTW